MSSTLRKPTDPHQTQARDRRDRERSDSGDLADEQQWLADLRLAMDVTGWTIDSLAAHWAIHRSYVERMLDGDKPFNVKRIVGLPDDLEARFEAIRAERLGSIVVTPLHGLAAQKAFVAGLVGLMSAPPDLPARASQMVKATAADQKKGVA